MQAELDSMATARPIRILGVNREGHELDNPTICSGRVLPWLQDTPQAKVWEAWGVAYRALVVLDANNIVIRTYSLNPPNDLGDPAKYAEVKAILIDATGS